MNGIKTLCAFLKSMRAKIHTNKIPALHPAPEKSGWRVLKSLAYEITKDLHQYEEASPDSPPKYGSSIVGRLKFFRKKAASGQTDYLRKKEVSEYYSKIEKNDDIPYIRSKEQYQIYVKNIIANLLSLIMDQEKHRIVPKEKIFFDGSAISLGSKKVNVKKHLMHAKDLRANTSATNILDFFKDAKHLSQKFELSDALARMMAIHECDANTANFMITTQQHLVKIDNTLSTFHPVIPLIQQNEYNKKSPSNIHYIAFLQEFIFENSHGQLYKKSDIPPEHRIDKTDHYTEQANPNLGAITEERIAAVKKNEYKLALFVTFLKRVKSYVDMPEAIKDYVFSQRPFGKHFEKLDSKEGKDAFQAFIHRMRQNYDAHLAQLQAFFAPAFSQLEALEQIVAKTKYAKYIPNTHINYGLAISAIHHAASQAEARAYRETRALGEADPEKIQQIQRQKEWNKNLHIWKNDESLSRNFFSHHKQMKKQSGIQRHGFSL